MMLRHIQFAAILGSGMLSGGNFYISAYAIPALLSPYTNKDITGHEAVLPAKALQTQWQHIYDTGKIFFPSLSALTSIVYLYLAYNSETADGTRPLHLVSAFCLISTVPYTFLAMMGNIKKIQANIKDEKEDVRMTLKRDIKEWGSLNYRRSGLYFVAFSAGIWAVLHS